MIKESAGTAVTGESSSSRTFTRPFPSFLVAESEPGLRAIALVLPYGTPGGAHTQSGRRHSSNRTGSHIVANGDFRDESRKLDEKMEGKTELIGPSVTLLNVSKGPKERGKRRNRPPGNAHTHTRKARPSGWWRVLNICILRSGPPRRMAVERNGPSKTPSQQSAVKVECAFSRMTEDHHNSAVCVCVCAWCVGHNSMFEHIICPSGGEREQAAADMRSEHGMQN